MPRGCKIDGEALKARRLEARRLLNEGLTEAEVARRLKTTRQSVNRWAKMPARELAQVRRQGCKSQLDDADRIKLREALLAGPKAEGFDGELWTLPRVRQLIARRFGSRFSTVHVWRVLRQLGFTPQRPEARARERDETKISEWKTKGWPRIKKARREDRTIVFLGESGLSQRPHRVRTWAPRGHTPILTFNFNGKASRRSRG